MLTPDEADSFREDDEDPRHNPQPGAYGIPQALPARPTGWQTQPATQIAWAIGYIRRRYGKHA